MMRTAASLIAIALVATACSTADASPVVEPPATTMAGDMHDPDNDEMHPMSQDHIPNPTGPVTSEYTISLTEFAFGTNALSLTPGETVRFRLVNEGELAHEFRLTTGHKASEHIAAGHSTHSDDGHHGGADIVVNVAAGDTRIVEVTLPSDPTAINQIACLIPGHYEAGMVANVSYSE